MCVWRRGRKWGRKSNGKLNEEEKEGKRKRRS